MKYSFNGLGETVATFNGSVSRGDIVTIGDNDTVAKASTDKELIGVCVSTNGDVVGIQLKGAVTLKYTGTAPMPGYVGFLTAGTNQVKVSPDARKVLVLRVNSVDKTVTVLL